METVRPFAKYPRTAASRWGRSSPVGDESGAAGVRLELALGDAFLRRAPVEGTGGY